jgi:hypothetical protein
MPSRTEAYVSLFKRPELSTQCVTAMSGEMHGDISCHSGAIRATTRAAGDLSLSRLDLLATEHVNFLLFPAWSKGGDGHTGLIGRISRSQMAK